MGFGRGFVYSARISDGPGGVMGQGLVYNWFVNKTKGVRLVLLRLNKKDPKCISAFLEGPKLPTFQNSQKDLLCQVLISQGPLCHFL